MDGNQRELAEFFADYLGLAEDPVLFFSVLFAIAIIAYVAIRLLLIPVLNRLMERTKTKWDDILVSKGVLFWLALLGPALILYIGAGYAPEYTEIWRRSILAGIVVIGGGTLDRVLSAVLEIYELYPFSKQRPIKALIQLLKLGVYVVGAITVIAMLLGKSPLAILGGITVMTTVLILVFKDTLLSLIANIQLIANDLVHPGDLIQVPEFGADGEVIDIALHTVKVQNWDNTIVTVPTYKLVDNFAVRPEFGNLGKSPLAILGGITVMTTALILVFKDTLLSLIANIQLIANDLIHPGDLIQVPEFGADGEVIDIALHTVKVQNWDNTIVTVPTYKLVDGSFQNWRGMIESGARRIKRSLLIDQTSVRFCDDELLEKFWRLRRLRPYLEAKQKELERANAAHCGDKNGQLPLNRRALTNLGTFRAYVVAYLNENAKLRKDITVMVRQLPPTPNGLPLEVYVYSGDTEWTQYEGIQADIFDHLLAALPYFDLRLFQYPTGEDVQTLKRWLEGEIVA